MNPYLLLILETTLDLLNHVVQETQQLAQQPRSITEPSLV